MKVLKWITNNPNRAMFLVPIILVAIISISHVVTWYDIANPLNWAIYLSIAIEIAAMTALVAVSTKVRGGIWFMFGIVTLIQIIGNVFFCFKEIDQNGALFKSWVELTAPMWEMMGTDTNDLVGMKRWLALLEGGLLPIISLTSLHFFVNYERKNQDETDHLLSSKANKEHLEESISQAEEIIRKTEEIYNEDEEEVVLSDVDLNDEKSIEDDEGKILEKAIKEYKEVKPKPINKTQTLTGKVNSPKESGGSKNIQRIE